MIVVLTLWLVTIVAFVSGVALCAFKRIRMLESRIRAPLQAHIEQQAEKLRRVQGVSAAHDLFLAGLSHELRTPLSGIRGAVQLLQTSELNGPQREYTQMIDYASATVLEMVDDMLTYSRTQAGKIRVESVPFNLREMIDDMLSLQTIKAQRRGIALIRDVSADVPDWLAGDRGKLNQILLNLIGNAVKFTEEGSVTVTVDVESRPGSQAQGPGAIQLRCSIKDTGVGIAADEIEAIFEPFTQGHAAGHDGRQGTGLGLTISERLIDAMGGTIHVESTLHESTCVTFHVTLGCVAAPAALVPVSDTAAIRPPRSLVVLVVEDDEINRLVCTRYLALVGHHPVAAADERQVQHLMSYLNYLPDVILMDVNLAGKSGIELALKIGKPEQGNWQTVPVIAMSADVSGSAQKQAEDAGVFMFLPKPFSAKQLYATLDAVVSAAACDEVLVDMIHRSTHGQDEVLKGVQDPDDPLTLDAAMVTESGYTPGADPVVRGEAQDGLCSSIVLVDQAWLLQEMDVLGTPLLFELLNIFRASTATAFQTMSGTVGRQDWQATADTLHRLQGSAANLGMQYVMSQTRALRAIVLLEGGPHAAFVADRIGQLEVACHASADSVRLMLLAAGQQGVAFAAQGHD